MASGRVVAVSIRRLSRVIEPLLAFGLGVNRPHFSLVEGEFSRARVRLGGVFTVVLLLDFKWCEVVQRGVQPVVVEPVHPGQGGQFEFVDGAERAVDLDAFGLIQPDHGLGQRVVEGVPDGADRGDRADVGEAFGVANGGLLGRFNRSMQHQPVR